MNIDPILALDLRPTIKHVMIVLTFRAYGDCGEAHMDYERLVRETSLSRRAVKGAVAELEEMGLIEVRRTWGRGNYNIYTINMEKVHSMHLLPSTKGAADAPKEPEKGANDAPLCEKNLAGEKGAEKVKKGAENALKGANNVKKGASPAPNKTKKIKNKTRAHTHARKMPPRSGPSGPVAKKGKKEPAVNRATMGAGGVMPQFHKTTSTEAREIWSNCLQGRTGQFCIPESALLGPIEGGRAMIFNLSGFERDQLEQKGDKYRLQSLIEQHTGEKLHVALSTQPITQEY